MNNSYITIIKEKRTALSRKRIPLNQNGCTANFRIGVPFEQNLHYIQEMVDNRNYIAHGNKTPKEVGRNFTILDLKNRCDYMEEVCNYVIAEYEAYIQERKYLRR